MLNSMHKYPQKGDSQSRQTIKKYKISKERRSIGVGAWHLQLTNASRSYRWTIIVLKSDHHKAKAEIVLGHIFGCPCIIILTISPF